MGNSLSLLNLLKPFLHFFHKNKALNKLLQFKFLRKILHCLNCLISSHTPCFYPIYKIFNTARAIIGARLTQNRC